MVNRVCFGNYNTTPECSEFCTEEQRKKCLEQRQKENFEMMKWIRP